MSAAAAPAGPPRSVRILGIALVGVLLTGLFIHRGFPYARLRDVIAAAAGRATGMRIAIDSIAPGIALAGPGLTARGVRVSAQNGDALQIDRVFLRPAWSSSWLTGTPALHIDARTAFGAADGTLTASTPLAWRGELYGLELGRLPSAAKLGGAGLGPVDASLDLRFPASGPEGTLHFTGGGGSVALAALPIPVPYARLSGDLVLGGDPLLEVKALEFEGDLAKGTATGRIGRAPSLEAAPLDLDVRLDTDPSLHSALRGLGARVNRDGSARLKITGTAARPSVR